MESAAFEAVYVWVREKLWALQMEGTAFIAWANTRGFVPIAFNNRYKAPIYLFILSPRLDVFCDRTYGKLHHHPSFQTLATAYGLSVLTCDTCDERFFHSFFPFLFTYIFFKLSTNLSVARIGVSLISF